MRAEGKPASLSLGNPLDDAVLGPDLREYARKLPSGTSSGGFYHQMRAYQQFHLLSSLSIKTLHERVDKIGGEQNYRASERFKESYSLFSASATQYPLEGCSYLFMRIFIWGAINRTTTKGVKLLMDCSRGIYD